jgi:hypothetical protein
MDTDTLVRARIRDKAGWHRPVALLLVAGVALAGSPAWAQTAVSGERDPASGSAEVVVTGTREADPTRMDEATRELVRVPGSLGDPLSAVFSLPGVVYAGGDNGAPAVRGTGPADNRYVVDSLPVPYVFHLVDIGGSVFNDNILKSFNLYAAGFGPEYSNVTGGVFDITLRDPKRQPLSTTLDLSFLRSGVFLESQLTEHSAAYLSARASNLSMFAKTGTSSEGIVIEKPPKNSDYQLKYSWDIGDGQKLSLSATGATDSLGLGIQSDSQAASRYPDAAGAARIDARYNNQMAAWDWAPGPATRLRVAAGHAVSTTDTSYGAGYYYNESLAADSGILRFETALGPVHTLHAGIEVVRNAHRADYDQALYICNEFDPTCNDTRRGFVVARESLTETERTATLSDTWRLTRHLVVDVGGQLHQNSYTGERFVHPRAALTWSFGEHSALSLKAGTYDRFPELNVVLPGIGNPRLRSSRANHFSAGFSQELPTGWSWSAEGYYKQLRNLPLALGPSEPDAARLYSNDVGGKAYGLDLLVTKRPTGRWSGWISASLGRSTRTNGRTGTTSTYYLDTPFLFNAIASYQWRPRLSVGGRVTVRSGQADTPIVGVEENAYFPGRVQPVYGAPYSTRLPLYARLDARVSWDFPTRHPSSLTLDIINILNRHNVDVRQLDYALSTVGAPPVIKEYDGLGLLPVLSYRVTF